MDKCISEKIIIDFKDEIADAHYSRTVAKSRKIEFPTETLELKKKFSNVARGKILEHLFSDTLKYNQIKGKIYKRFVLRPMKHQLSNQKLLCDYLYVSIQHMLVIIELKMVKSMTSMPLVRIEDHQRENLLDADNSSIMNGWLIQWHKFKQKDGGMFAISGTILDIYINNYKKFKKIIGIKNNLSSRKSISREDLTEAVYYYKKKERKEVILLNLKTVELLGKEIKIINIEEL